MIGRKTGRERKRKTTPHTHELTLLCERIVEKVVCAVWRELPLPHSVGDYRVRVRNERDRQTDTQTECLCVYVGERARGRGREGNRASERGRETISTHP